MKTSLANDYCFIIQKDIILGDELPGARRKALTEHLQICAACRKFADLQTSLNRSLAADLHARRPQPRILKNLCRHIAGKKVNKTGLIPNRLLQALGYRIPLYQAVMVALVVFCAYRGAVRLREPVTAKSLPSAVTTSVDESVIETVQAAQALQVMRRQKIGRSINEYPLYGRFTFQDSGNPSLWF